MNKWTKRFLDLAEVVAGWSKDPSTKCGAVIVDDEHRVLSVGYNGFPRKTNDGKSLYDNREEKYRRVVHAEKNAILFARRDLTGATIYVSPMPPCAQCAGMIIQAGISKVISYDPTPEQWERWGRDMETSMAMFLESGVDLCLVSSRS